MDDNPGEIKADDLEKVRQIYKNATILADPIACKKGNQKKSNDVESKGKLLKEKKNNKNKIYTLINTLRRNPQRQLEICMRHDGLDGLQL